MSEEKVILVNEKRHLYYARGDGNRLFISEKRSDAVQLPPESALNYLRNCIPAKQRGEWRTEPLPAVPADAETRFDKGNFDWARAAQQLQEFYCELQAYHTALPERLRRTEAKISDVEHFLELNRPSLSEGYRMAMLLHRLRQTRRKWKDEMLCTGLLLDAPVPQYITGAVCTELEKQKHRTYQPRILTGLPWRNGKENK